MPPAGVKKGSKRARQYEHIKDSLKDEGRSEAKAEEIRRVMRKLRADLMKGIAADELAIAFDVLGRIEQSAHHLYEAALEADAVP